MTLIPLGIAANFLSLNAAEAFTFPALTVAVSVITILVVAAM